LLGATALAQALQLTAPTPIGVQFALGWLESRKFTEIGAIVLLQNSMEIPVQVVIESIISSNA